VRDYVHVTDVVLAAQLALTDEQWAGPVAVGSGTSLSVLDVVDVVRQRTGAELPVRHGPARPGEMPAVIVDSSLARSRGWEPRIDFPTGVAGVWEEWRELDIDGAVPLPGGAGMSAATSERS
jgi:UDP-glucose 4-epimerase